MMKRIKLDTRTMLRSKVTLLFLTLGLLIAVPAVALAQDAGDPTGAPSPAPPAPTIQSDKADYAPSELVTLTGSNWQPGESVNINVNDDVGQTWNRNVDVIADENGNITDQFNLPNHFVVTYYVTATGADSGAVAKMTFTDGNLRAQGDVTGSEKWMLTWTRYSGTTTCGKPSGGSIVEGPEEEILGQGNGSRSIQNDRTLFSDATNSVKLIASPGLVDNTGNKEFDRWTDHEGNFVSNNQEICVVSFSLDTRTYTAHYITPDGVNDAPENLVPGGQSTNEDTQRVFNTSNRNLISVSDRDAGSNPVRVRLFANNGTLTLSGTSGLTFSPVGTNNDGTNDASMQFTGTISNINNALDGLRFTPNANFNGFSSLTIITDDQGNIGTGGAQIDIGSVSITVNNVDNDAPVNTVPAAQTTTEDTAKVFDTANDNAISVSDPDAGNRPVRVRLDVTNGTLTLSGTSGLTFSPVGTSNVGANDASMTFTGTIFNINSALDGLRYDPTADFNSAPPNGPARLAISTNDLGNTLGISGTGPQRIDTDVLQITVTPGNQAPVAVDDEGTTDEGEPLTVEAPGVLGNDTDADDGDDLMAEVVAGPSSGQLTLDPDGSYTYTPNANFNGRDTFTYRANDGTANSNTATVTINVAPVDDPPAAVNDQATVQEDDPATPINVLGNDTDSDGGPKTIASVTQPSNGSVVLTGDSPGAHTGLTYKPNANYCNDPPATNLDTFTYTLNGGSQNAQGTVSMKVTCVNDAPNTPSNLSSDESLNNDGAFTLSWDAANPLDVDGDDTVTYTLEHRDANDPNWTEVVNSLNVTTYTFTNEPEGTWDYRVKAVDNHGASSAGYSEALEEVVVDKTAPSAPTATTTPSAADYTTSGGAKWFKDSVTVSYGGSTDDPLADGSDGSGTGTGNITYTADQTFTTAGAHTYRGTASDTAGNESNAASDTLNVDTAAPTSSVNATVPDGTGTANLADDTWTNKNVTVILNAQDATGGAANNSGVKEIVYKIGSSGTETTATGSSVTLPEFSSEGTRTIYFRAADNVGHVEDPAGTAEWNTFTVKIDKSGPTAPTLSFNTSANQSLKATVSGVDWYKDSALIDVADNGDKTLADTSDGSGVDAASLLPNPFSVSTNGTSTASRKVSDNATNESDAGTLEVNVDAANPTLGNGNCPSAGPFILNSGDGTQSVSITASDGESGVDDAASTLSGPVNTSTVGEKTLTFKAVDHVGHEVTKECNYNVNYDFGSGSGGSFAEPVRDTELNQLAAGAGVPVKFGLGADYGLNIFAIGYPTSKRIDCSTGLPTDPVEETVTISKSGLHYDAASGLYTYVWKTDKAWKGTCRELNLKLADGTDHPVKFRFK
jgi:VCBS repeat-containing protein